MGNKLGMKRQVVDEKYTRPQGLYQHKDVDHKKLRKLILDSKLAPCFPGDDDAGLDLEECPICFLCYPGLNRSRCCTKGICTECFLQMKMSFSTRPTRCPFCKTSDYAVRYRGVKGKEERILEQIEEQLVIEAKIRQRQQEIQDEEDRILQQREMGSSSCVGPNEVAYCSTRGTAFSRDFSAPSAITLATPQGRNRGGEFDIDLEDVMVVEAILLSIQEKDRLQNPTTDHVAWSEEYATNNHRPMGVVASVDGSSSSATSPSSGLACAIATQQMGTDNGIGDTAAPYQLAVIDNAEEWSDHESEMAGIGAFYGGSDRYDASFRATGALAHQHESQGSFATSMIIPESFEEQILLAMAVSLGDAHMKSNTAGVAWN